VKGANQWNMVWCVVGVEDGESLEKVETHGRDCRVAALRSTRGIFRAQKFGAEKGRRIGAEVKKVRVCKSQKI
jgi:hypothetical protein